jgi:hypothetical protein
MYDKIFKFYEDPGHGWLAVKVLDLYKLGLSPSDFSCYSYWKGQTVYLEEDCDAPKFIEAFKNAHLNRSAPIFQMIEHTGRSPIRTYPCIKEHSC